MCEQVSFIKVMSSKGAINTGNEWRIGGLFKDKLTGLREPEFLLVDKVIKYVRSLFKNHTM